MASAEQQAIAAIDAAEQMALANIQLIRQMKKLMPGEFGMLLEPAIQTQSAGIRGVAAVERKVVRKASAYNRRFAKAYKKLKKAKPRSKHASLMKQAHRMARKK
jgi:hypothetical protein